MGSPNRSVDVGDDDGLGIDGADNIWTEKLESYFIYLMVDEIAKGNMQTTTFANAAWKTIVEEIKRKTGKEYTYYQLKNKYHNLRARWSDFSNLLKEKEIRYNSETGEVIATDDVWLKLYQRCRRAKTFRKKGLKDYDKLCVIFGCPAVQYICDDNDRKNDHLSDGSSEGGEFAHRAKKGNKFSFRSPGMDTTKGEKSCYKRRKLDKKTSSTTASLDSVGDVGDGCGSQSEQQFQDVLRCMEALNALDGIDGPSYAKATKYIHDDPLWRKMFLCMPDQRKKDWVLNI